MKHKTDLIQTAELSAERTIKKWIWRVLRKSFLQALRKALTIRHKPFSVDSTDSSTSEMKNDEDERIRTKTQVELSLSALNSCFAFVDRVSQAWQTQLKEEQHERVAEWVEDVYRHGKTRLWTGDPIDVNSSNFENENLNAADNEEKPLEHRYKKEPSYHSNTKGRTESDAKRDDTTVESLDKSFHRKDTLPKSTSDSHRDHDYRHSTNPNVYCFLRALGRRLKVDSPGMSVPDALKEIKEFTRHHPTYWPLDNSIIDQACLDMSRRMRARDKHGRGTNNAGDTKKTVRFKVLPKSVWETKQQKRKISEKAESNKSMEDEGDDFGESKETQETISSKRGDDHESKVETALLVSIKKRKRSGRSHNPLHAAQKKTRRTNEHEIPRAPFDVPQYFDGKFPMNLTLEDKKALDKLLILDGAEQNSNTSEQASTAAPEVLAGLFGGLRKVGQTHHMLQNPKTYNHRTFLSNESDKITRRKERVSLQERLDPNRIATGREENPDKRKSNFSRTVDWFDERKRFFDFDLGWCLLEIVTEENQKRLCAFSSMEICLEDRDR